MGSEYEAWVRETYYPGVSDVEWDELCRVERPVRKVVKKKSSKKKVSRED